MQLKNILFSWHELFKFKSFYFLQGLDLSVDTAIKFNYSNQTANKCTICYSTRKYLTVPKDVFKISINLIQYKVIIFPKQHENCNVHRVCPL
jgi:hypothetical protein